MPMHTCFSFIYNYRQDTFVSADDIIITNIEDTTDGLQVTFFVSGMSGGVITAQAATEAIQVSIFEGLISGLTVKYWKLFMLHKNGLNILYTHMKYGDFFHFSLLLEVLTRV